MGDITYLTLYSKENKDCILRLVLLQEEPYLMSNDNSNGEAVSVKLDRIDLVELGKALIKAWEQMKV